jgi:hypothetical protein
VPQKVGDFQDLRLPNVFRLLKWDSKSGDSIEFRIKERSPVRDSLDARQTRFLYLAEKSDGQTILVKFVRRYCSELHSFCAALGYAPALLAYERLPGGCRKQLGMP